MRSLFASNVTLGRRHHNGKLTFSANADLGTAVRTITANSTAQFDGIISGTGGGIQQIRHGHLDPHQQLQFVHREYRDKRNRRCPPGYRQRRAWNRDENRHQYIGKCRSPRWSEPLGTRQQWGADFTLGSNISYSLSGAAGVIRNAAGNNTIAGNIGMTSGNGTVKILSNGGSLTLSGTVTANVTRDFELSGTSTGANTFSGVLRDNGANLASLVKSGAGTWTVSGSNTHTNGTRVTAGTLILGNNNALGAPTGSLAVTGGTLDMNGYNATVGLLTGNSGALITTSSNASIVLTASSSTSGTYAGSIANTSGTLGLTKGGPAL